MKKIGCKNDYDGDDREANEGGWWRRRIVALMKEELRLNLKRMYKEL